MPAEGFEPPTYGLQNRCTTTVLSRPGALIIALCHRFLAQEVDRLVQLGSPEKAFVGAGDVADRDFHADHYGFDIHARRALRWRSCS